MKYLVVGIWTNLDPSSILDRQESSSILAVVQIITLDKLVIVIPPLSGNFGYSRGSSQVDL